MRALDAEHYLLEIKLKKKGQAFDRYPFSLPAVRHLGALSLHPKVTFIVGENGSGKSTLLEATAVAFGFNPEGGTKNFNFQTRPSHSELHEHLTLVKGVARAKDGFFLRAESFFNLATEIERLDEGPHGASIIDSYGGVSLHQQSHGESFFALMMSRFGGNGLYILDEPEAALSPQRQLAMMSRLHQLVQARSQFLIATHSPILLAYPDACIYQIGANGLEKVDYEDTEHYMVTKYFLNNYKRQIDRLLD
ncbi:AAA family ATPase [Xanthomonas oryzae]|uniref:AAA family ATPase n=1 Tax=Xanthomonas oryzae TaxID=347 RepID=UPI001034395E|nr:AAA family ATPase [Xanthomonas oryzae]QBH01524.1 ATP-binding cassette domain-containing protein [Xanthomonas oryzae]